MPYKWKDKKKEYHREYHKKWYKDNEDKVKRNAKAATARKEVWYRELKSQYSCDHCGANHPAILEFHHEDPKKKEFAIGVFQSKSKKNILAEIEKCTPLCKNCHAIVHWRIRNSKRKREDFKELPQNFGEYIGKEIIVARGNTSPHSPSGTWPGILRGLSYGCLEIEVGGKSSRYPYGDYAFWIKK